MATRSFYPLPQLPISLRPPPTPYIDAGRANLQHVEQRRLPGVVETEEEKLCVLVRQSERRKDIPDYSRQLPSSLLAREEQI